MLVLILSPRTTSSCDAISSLFWASARAPLLLLLASKGTTNRDPLEGSVGRAIDSTRRLLRAKGGEEEMGAREAGKQT